MSNARVQSIQAVADFHEYLQNFRRCLKKELESLESELGSISGWILEGACEYWNRERQMAQRNLNEFQQQLSRCLSSVRADEQRPCTEEKKRVARARQRLALCEEKVRMAHSAVGQWETRRQRVRTRVEHCRDLVDSDLSVAGTRLLRHLEALEAYANLGRQSRVSPESQPAPTEKQPAAAAEQQMSHEDNDNSRTHEPTSPRAHEPTKEIE